jgi:ligand-binding SRPBCC domain-containing protein
VRAAWLRPTVASRYAAAVPVLELHTTIRAPIERVFDLCRSIDAHAAAATGTSERAIAGRTTGLLELGETVTWSARHFGLRWRLTSRMMAVDRPRHFRDSMVAGVFRRFDHDHTFRQDGDVTRVVDVFDYTSPLGVLGRLADALLVKGHMQRFLEERMRTIRELAEGDGWRPFLPPT